MDERFAEEDLSEILDAEEISRLKTPPTIPELLEFIPTNVGDVETDEEKRARTRAQATENGSRNIPNTVCGLVGTFLISAKMFLLPCVLWAISGTFLSCS